MKKITFLFLLVFSIQTGFSQLSIKYGVTAGLNVSSGILPDLTLNTDINSILDGDAIAEGTPQLADFKNQFKIGGFIRLDGKIGFAKVNVNYTKTNIYKDVDPTTFDVAALDINLTYLDIDFTYNLNLFKGFYFSAGYIPSFLLSQDENYDINSFDQRILTGLGFRFNNGATLDFDAIIGLSEVIDGSYIHNVMLPITLNFPLN